MDELFTRYMYYRRACLGIKNTTTQALRDFFSQDSYAMLQEEKTLSDLESLLGFWQKVAAQEEFSEPVLRRLFVLSYAPNGMWAHLVSTWFLANRDEKDNLDEEAFYRFLNVVTGFIFAYAFERPGVNALRTPVYPELIKIVNHEQVQFESYHFDRNEVADRLHTYVFTNGRVITKSMLAWWAFQDKEQDLLSLEQPLELEHIYARKRNEVSPLVNQKNFDALGNKSLLEKRINIRAADYAFKDKRKYYKGFVGLKNKKREGTQIHELIAMADSQRGFTEADIEARTNRIIQSFVAYLETWGLIK